MFLVLFTRKKTNIKIENVNHILGKSIRSNDVLKILTLYLLNISPLEYFILDMKFSGYEELL